MCVYLKINHLMSRLVCIKMDFEERDFSFKHPFTAIIAGMTGSGKTVLLRQLLQDNKYTLSGLGPIKILWSYGVWQDLYNQPIDGIEVNYLEGLPSQDDLSLMKPNILVIDDLMTELGGNKNLANLFTKGSHHNNLSIFFIVQNLFHQGPQMRTISLNSHYMILMKNPRDKSQISHLARQLYPENMKFLIEAYNDATSQRYGYLVVDMKQDTPAKVRVRTRLTCEGSAI